MLFFCAIIVMSKRLRAVMKEQTKNESASITKYDLLFESRITRLESAIINIDKNFSEIKDSMKDIKADIKDVRSEIRDVRKDVRNDFIWTVTAIAGVLGLMAHGFQWI